MTESEPKMMTEEDITKLVDLKVNELAKEVYKAVYTQLDANEQVVAQLLPAYQELAMGVEVIVHKLWGESIEESEDFKAKLATARKTMMKWINDSAKEAGQSPQDLADTMGKLFPTKSAKPESE